MFQCLSCLIAAMPFGLWIHNSFDTSYPVPPGQFSSGVADAAIVIDAVVGVVPDPDIDVAAAVVMVMVWKP